MRSEDLREVLTVMIRNQIVVFGEAELVLDAETLQNGGSIVAVADRVLDKLNIEIREIERLRLGLYEKYKVEGLSKDEFLERREKYASQLTELVRWKEEWEREMRAVEENEVVRQEVLRRVEKCGNVETVSDEMMGEWVEKVLVFDEGRVEVVWG